MATSLLGAGMLLQSGVFQRDGECVRGPELDAEQTGYGPGYRIYECRDGDWLALVLPDPESWARLRVLPELASVPAEYAPLRGGSLDATARHARSASSSGRSRPLRRPSGSRDCGSAEVPVEAIESMSRDEFRRSILDDPLNRQLGRVAMFETPEWGRFEQIGPLLRSGPTTGRGPSLVLPGVGDHSREVLAELGFGEDETDALLAAKVARQR